MIQALLLVIVVVFAILALFAHVALDPWWGVRALAVIMALGAVGFYGRVSPP